MNPVDDIIQLRERAAQQLAACDVAAMSDTELSHADARIERGSPFWSPAYKSIMRRTAECIALRKERDQLRQELDNSKEQHKQDRFSVGSHWQSKYTALLAERDQLRAENGRLREAQAAATAFNQQYQGKEQT